MTFFDIVAIICATTPIVYIVFMFATITEKEPPSDRHITQLFILFGAACLIWLASGIYIVGGCFRGRKMAFFGILITIISLGFILLSLL
jgi:hypothetical protein